MQTLQALYHKLLEGRIVTIRFPDKRAYDSLRTALVKYNSLMVGIDISTSSLCADWNVDNTGKFWLGKSRRSRATWEIVDESAPTVRNIVETDSSERDSLGDLFVASSEDSCASGSQGEEPLQHDSQELGFASVWEIATRGGFSADSDEPQTSADNL